MIKDRYITLTRKAVTEVPDGAGSSTITTVTSEFKGLLCYLSSHEQYKRERDSVVVEGRLFTDEVLAVGDIVVDSGGAEFKVVGALNYFHRYYELVTK